MCVLLPAGTKLMLQDDDPAHDCWHEFPTSGGRADRHPQLSPSGSGRSRSPLNVPELRAVSASQCDSTMSPFALKIRGISKDARNATRARVAGKVGLDAFRQSGCRPNCPAASSSVARSRCALITTPRVLLLVSRWRALDEYLRLRMRRVMLRRIQRERSVTPSSRDPHSPRATRRGHVVCI